MSEQFDIFGLDCMDVKILTMSPIIYTSFAMRLIAVTGICSVFADTSIEKESSHFPSNFQTAVSHIIYQFGKTSLNRNMHRVRY